MRVVLFCHSLISDWNHGNAHFLRGVVSELLRRGHAVRVLEPANGWSLSNLLRDAGADAIGSFKLAYPALHSAFYDLATLDLNSVLADADLVIAHEWSDPELVHRLGRHRRSHAYRLLFHDTHHRAATAPETMAAYDLSGFDGVLAFGEVLRRIYLDRGWARAAWTWHEAADTSLFYPKARSAAVDVVWIGNWGDDERTRGLEEFLFGPIRALSLRATVHGVRYPDQARAALARAGITYGGYIANHRVPEEFSRHRMTVHVPRRPYTAALPGIPTIRIFEALACGIPLISAPWDDAEGLFARGDFLVARNGTEMREHMQTLIADEPYAAALAERGRRTILARHTCAHRVDELLAIAEHELGIDSRPEASAECAAE